MVYNKILVCFIFLMCCCSNGALAQQNNEALALLESKGNTLVYLGEAHGLDTYMATNGQTQQIVYVTPDKKAVLMGKLLNRNGNVSKWQILEYAKQTADKRGKSKAFQENVLSMRVGYDGPLLVAFVSPTCSVCEKFWRDVGKQIAEGRLQVEVIPVPSGSDEKAVRESQKIILSLMNEHENVNAFISYTLGNYTKPLKVADSSLLKGLQTNIEIFQGFGFDRTPSFIGIQPDNTQIIARGWPIELRNILPKYNPVR